MGFYTNSGTTTASINGSITTTSSKLTATPIGGTSYNGSATTLGTVGAGKVWRILSATIEGQSNDSGSFRECVITANGVALVGLTGMATASAYSTGNSSVSYDYAACPVITAGQTVVVSAASNCKAYGCVIYVQEDA